MALPPYTSKDELDASGAPVVPLEPVAAVAPNRGTENVASSLDYLAALQRVHQTLSFGTAPRMEWDDASRVLTLSGDLVVRYVVDDPTSTFPVIRSTTLKSGSYSFGTNTMVFIPLGFDADVLITAGGTVVPPSAGSLAYFKDDGEAQQFFRADTGTNGRQNALRYIQFGRKAGTSLQVLGKVVLRNGAPVEDFRDEEYAGDTVTQQTRRYVNQDRNLMMYGAGIATFSSTDPSVRLVRTTQNLELLTSNGTRTTVTGLVAGVKLTATNPVLAVSLNRVLGSVAPKPATATNFSALSSDNTDMVMLGFWDEVQDIFRWRDGSGFAPGYSYRIGLCCDFTPSFLIERILPELVFATDALAYADLASRPATNRVAMVVDNFNATRDRIRLITQESIDGGGAASAPAETLRAAGVEIATIYAAGAVSGGITRLQVLNAIGADKARVEAALVGASRLVDYQANGSIEVTQADGVTAGDLSADSLIADTAVLTPEIHAAAGDTVEFRDSSGADLAVVASRYVHVDRIRGTQPTLRIENASALGTLHPIQASQGLFEGFVRVDGTGLSEPQVRAAGAEVAFRDSAGVNVVDVRAKDVRAHDLRLFDDPTVSGGLGDVLLQAQSPNPTVPSETGLQISDTYPTPVCLRVSPLSGGGAIELASVRMPSTRTYVRVQNSTASDERDVWARDLYLNSTGAGAGAIYFDEPSAPSPAARLTSDAGGARLRWEQPGGDLERVAARTLELSRAGSLSTVTSRLSSLQQTVASASATGSFGEVLRAGDISGHYSGRALIESAGVASANTAIMTGCVQYNTGAAAWYVDTRPFGDPTLGPFRPEVLSLSTAPGGVFQFATSQPIDNGATGAAKLSWTASAQYDDGGTWYPLSVVLVDVYAGVAPLSILEFEVWHVASPPGASSGAGTRVAFADIQNVRLCVHVHSPEFSV